MFRQLSSCQHTAWASLRSTLLVQGRVVLRRNRLRRKAVCAHSRKNCGENGGESALLRRTSNGAATTLCRVWRNPSSSNGSELSTQACSRLATVTLLHSLTKVTTMRREGDTKPTKLIGIRYLLFWSEGDRQEN